MSHLIPINSPSLLSQHIFSYQLKIFYSSTYIGVPDRCWTRISWCDNQVS